MSGLDWLNGLGAEEAIETLLRCCGSRAWARAVAAKRPFADSASLIFEAERAWEAMPRSEVLAAFSQHPRIGDLSTLKAKFASTANWAGQEQSGVAAASEEVLRELARDNAEYEARFGFIFLVCASGRTADEMLQILQARLRNDAETEMRQAAGEQAKIMRLRIEKLLRNGVGK